MVTVLTWALSGFAAGWLARFVIGSRRALDRDLEKQVRLLNDLERRVLSRVLRRKPGVDDPNRAFDDQLTPLVVFLALVVFVPACAVNPRPITSPPIAVRESSTSVMLQGKPLDLHLSAPQGPAAGDVLVLYASGDGGWFGAAVDMFHRVGRAGYYTVGFSAKAFLKLDRPKSSVVSPGDIMQEYQQILAQARAAMHLSPSIPAILTGWSRGAAFAVLAGSERGAPPNLGGVIAIGLSNGEDLEVNGPADETDDGAATQSQWTWPFEPYRRIAQLGNTPCAVIQASGDNYLPASRAHELFGPDTPTRRFYAIDARNHRFSGGKAAFDQALLDAIEWMASFDRSLDTLETSTGVGR